MTATAWGDRHADDGGEAAMLAKTEANLRRLAEQGHTGAGVVRPVPAPEAAPQDPYVAHLKERLVTTAEGQGMVEQTIAEPAPAPPWRPGTPGTVQSDRPAPGSVIASDRADPGVRWDAGAEVRKAQVGKAQEAARAAALALARSVRPPDPAPDPYADLPPDQRAPVKQSEPKEVVDPYAPLPHTAG